ncbi:MAG: DUF5683 domain-containing protein, partial [Candidatus Thorarchaeota archaeon]
MCPKKILFIFFLFFLLLQHFFFATRIKAQDNKIVIIKSDPPGAMLYLQGENSFVGITPFKIKPNLMGKYNITAIKSGYERSKVEYYFKGTEKGILRLRLAPKTRFKAGIRSIVFPGWGQVYSERKKTGIFISLVQLSAGILTLVSHMDYDNAFKEYKNSIKDYEENKWNSEVRDQYWNAVVDTHEKAGDAFDKRQTWLYITGGLWIYNFLDLILFFSLP